MHQTPISFMIKPVSAACDLACDYCFYRDASLHRETAVHPLMSKAVVDQLIGKSLSSFQTITYIFQGGEPTLAGLPFFQYFVDKVEQERRSESAVHYALQTNGMHLDQEWVAFLKQHSFLVGVSFDGMPRLHDLHRRDLLGNGSARRVLQSIALLQQEGVAFNILSVVTEDLAHNAKPVYSYLLQRNLLHQQYIPCINPLHGGADLLHASSYGLFLKELFDLWYESLLHGVAVHIRFFENLVMMLGGYPPESCDMAGRCSPQYVIESNGNVYPCDFYALDEYLLGSVISDDFPTFAQQAQTNHFLEHTENQIDSCSTCSWSMLCRGGCKRFRTSDGYRFCPSMRTFFPYAYGRLQIIAQQKFASQKPS